MALLGVKMGHGYTSFHLNNVHMHLLLPLTLPSSVKVNSETSGYKYTAQTLR
jgi:hypothetical protein